MRIKRRTSWFIAVSITVMPSFAKAQVVQISCEQYARDYSNMVAPRSGGAAVANPMTQYPGGTQRNNQNPLARENMEWRQIAPNQEAFRMAYDRCMANRR